MKYPQVTEWSLLQYRESLQEKRASVSSDSQDAIDRLIRTIDAALDHPGELRPDEVEFGVTSLRRVPPDELPAFLNQQTLGVGRDDPPIIVIGTEPAERADSAEDVAWHAIYSVLVSADSRPEVLDRIVAGSSWVATTKGVWNSTDKRRYHLQANDFIHVERVGGSPTWKVVAEVVAPDSADQWHDLLETRLGQPGLGDYAYQIDRSALPAMTADKGAPPSDIRVAFLVEVVRLLRQNARVLLLHGFGGRGRWLDWWTQDQRLTAAFLDLDSRNVELDWRYVPSLPSSAGKRDSLGTLSHDGRTVIYSRALSNRVTAAYIEAVRHEIQPTR